MENKQKIMYYFFLGSASWIGICIYFVLSIPIFIYRFTVVNLIVPNFFPKIGRPISIAGQGMATDFIPKYLESSYRSGVVVNSTFKGTIKYSDLYQAFEKLCLNRTDHQGVIVYPELKQCVHYLMGFMLWKEEENFLLEDHIFVHDIGHDSSEESSEIFVSTLREKLLNTPFKSDKSPWELHLVQNYRNSKLCNDVMSIIVIWIHHSVADGPSVINLMGGLVYEKRVENMNLHFPKQRQSTSMNSVLSVVPTFFKIIRDMGYLADLVLHKSGSPWLVNDNQKSGKLLVAKTKIISVKSIKNIKDKLGVSFTAVILSSVARGIKKCVEKINGSCIQQSQKIPVVIPVPKWSPKDQIGLFSTATILDLPMFPCKDPANSIFACHERLNSAKQSTIPATLIIFACLFHSNIAPVARFLCRNRACPIFLSILPLPKDDCYFSGKHKLVAFDYCYGGLLGDGGVGITVTSYEDDLRIVMTSEGAIMDRETLSFLVTSIENQFVLLATATNSFTK